MMSNLSLADRHSDPMKSFKPKNVLKQKVDPDNELRSINFRQNVLVRMFSEF